MNDLNAVGNRGVFGFSTRPAVWHLDLPYTTSGLNLTAFLMNVGWMEEFYG